VPPVFTNIWLPDVEEYVAVPVAPETAKDKSLMVWATSVGLACKFVNVTSTKPAPVEKVAVASTEPPLVVAPVGVMKVAPYPMLVRPSDNNNTDIDLVI
jgi:hypothetical protein